jgi:hypothetical protein
MRVDLDGLCRIRQIANPQCIRKGQAQLTMLQFHAGFLRNILVQARID